ncbi:MAG: zinc dependent phospholipase C family protein [Flavisolibacter sp.]
MVAAEGPRHYIDLDYYGAWPFDSLPRKWESAVARYGEDSLRAHGIVPWWIQIMYQRLIKAFREKDAGLILKLSAEIGHYIADAHVPLHACSNHNGQLTNQQGIHAFWESRVPELLAEKDWDFLLGKAGYLSHPAQYIWQRVLESAAASDTVLQKEKQLSDRYPANQKFSFELRNGKLVRQYSSGFTSLYDGLLGGMVERRMRLSIYSVASFWYTAWVEAGQPDLSTLTSIHYSEQELQEWNEMDRAWREKEMMGRKEEE